MEASSFFLTGNHPVRVVSRHHFGRPLMKKAITLFMEGFIEGWNGSSVNLLEIRNRQKRPPPDLTSAYT